MNQMTLAPLATSILLNAISKVEGKPGAALKAANPQYYAQLEGLHLLFNALKAKYPSSTEKERLTRALNMLYTSSQEDEEARNVYLRDFFALSEAVMKQSVWGAAIGRERAQRMWQAYDDAHGVGAAELEYEHRRTCGTDHSLDELEESEDADARPVADYRERSSSPPAGAGPVVPDNEPQDFVEALELVNGWLNAVVSTVLGVEGTQALVPNGLSYMRYRVEDKPDAEWFECFSAEQAIEVQMINNRAAKVKRARVEGEARQKMLDKLAV